MKCVPDQEMKMKKKNFYSDDQHERGNVHQVTCLDEEKRQSHWAAFSLVIVTFTIIMA